MASIPQGAKALRTVLTRGARMTHFMRRRSKLSGAKFAQTLVFGWGANPEATYEELAQTAATLGVRISPQGLEQRFTEAAAQCLERVLQAAVHQVIAAAPVAIPLLQRFSAVYVDDSTQVQLPALKLQVRMDCKSG